MPVLVISDAIKGLLFFFSRSEFSEEPLSCRKNTTFYYRMEFILIFLQNFTKNRFDFHLLPQTVAIGGHAFPS